MNRAFSAPEITQESPSLGTDLIESPLPPMRNLLSEETLAEPNRELRNYTHTDRANGSSATLAPRKDHFPIFFPDPSPLREHLIALQKWEGYVTEVGNTTFWARIQVLLGEGGDQEAEIFIEEISLEDRALIEPGAVFYWTIGYLDKPSGRLRVSHIRFRRLPVWSEQEIEAAREGTIRLKNLLDGNSAA